ncbi:MAG: 3-phosphoshikimate 1-carboxyvinyltransferase, partial [Kangiellaceae bacterium]|nr:3-phosphoshikimate 1-carboxyvinyltransferase [Kangiellaceae bacterium]
AGEDYLEIHGRGREAANLVAAEIETHEDHRMAMSMALLGTKIDGIKILNAEVVEKSFPTYWNLLSAVGLQSREI